MKKFLLIVAVAAVALLADSQLASAGRRGGRGGCGGGGCGSSGGCGMGGCGQVGYAGCQTCGGGYIQHGGARIHASASCPTCFGGVCTINSVGGNVAATDATAATLVVTLPEDATLTIDNAPTVSTSAQRVFVSPSLEAGKEYEYTLKAKVIREGKAQTVTAQVTVRSGEVSRVELKIPATSVAQ